VPETDLAAGVSSTALMVAAARAIETNHPHGLIRDEFAEQFVRSARTSGVLPTHIEDVELGDDDPVWGRGGRYFALRTRVFDEFLTEAAQSAPQIVLLGAGLDARAFRLSWPAHTKFYEIDREDVFTFKAKVLAGLGAETRFEHRLLVADLASDWDRVLLDAGFDPATPTAWVAEGLLPYLPAAVEEKLVRTVDALSAPGSHLGFEILLGQEAAQVREHSLYETTAAKTGSHLASLFDTDPRPDSVGALRAAGWAMTSSPVAEFTAHYGRGPAPEVQDPIQQSRWVLGYKGA
jgi:methyltransferase (TIGR00027 family)